MRWRALGADKSSGADRSITVEADSEKAALALANADGVLVSKLKRLPDATGAHAATAEARIPLVETGPSTVPYASRVDPQDAWLKRIVQSRRTRFFAVGVLCIATIVVAAMLALKPRRFSRDEVLAGIGSQFVIDPKEVRSVDGTITQLGFSEDNLRSIRLETNGDHITYAHVTVMVYKPWMVGVLLHPETVGTALGTGTDAARSMLHYRELLDRFALNVGGFKNDLEAKTWVDSSLKAIVTSPQDQVKLRRRGWSLTMVLDDPGGDLKLAMDTQK
ncbi:MAG TPA: hypothetical protein VLI90_09650 [Tepidisphaeraceae bacterium]|nr:hypothetical protein [Tepidisphaeraceae bacterium]